MMERNEQPVIVGGNACVRRGCRPLLLSTTFLVSISASAAFATDLTDTKPIDTNGSYSTGDTLNITSSGVLAYYGSGGVSTLSTGTGVINNSGVVVVTDTEFVQVSGTFNQNGGTVLTAVAGGALSFTGILNNNGTDSLVYVEAGSGMSVAGALNNNGDNVVVNLGTLTAPLTNAGSTLNSGTFQGTISNSGTFYNDTAGVVFITTASTSGDLINENQFVATAVTVLADGVVANTATGTMGTDSVTVNAGGTVYNEGTLTATFTGVGGTGWIVNNGTFLNEATGSVTASVITTSGQLANTGTMNASVVSASSGGVIANTGTLTADVSIADGGTGYNTGTMNGDIDSAGSFVNDVGGTVNATTVSTSGEFINNDQVNASLVNVADGGLFANTVDGTVVSDIRTRVGGVGYNQGVISGDINNEGTFQNDVGGSISANTVTSSGTFLNDSTLNANTTTVTGGNFANSAGVVSDVTVSGGAFANSNTGQIDGDVSVTGGAMINNGTIDTTGATGSFDNAGFTQNTGDIITTTLNSSGILENTDTGNIQAQTSITVSGDSLNAGLMNTLGTLGITDGQFFNTGTMSSTGAMSFTGDATVINVDGGVITATAGLSNAATMSNGGTLNASVANSGVLQNEITGSILGDMNNSSVLINNGSIDTTGATGTFVNSNYTQNAGDITTTTFNSSGTLDNTDTGDIQAQTAITVSGDSLNAGVMNSAGTVDITAGQFINTGTLSSTGAMGVSAGGTVINFGGEITATAGLTNNGSVGNTGQVTADVVNNNFFRNEASGRVSGDMTNTATLENVGLINTLGGTTRTFENSGSAQNAGAVLTNTLNNTGTLGNADTGLVLALDAITLSGTTTNAGNMIALGNVDMTAGTTQNDGFLASLGGTTVGLNADLTNLGTMFALGGLNNEGTMFTSGTVVGNTLNTGTLTSMDGQFTGDLTNEALMFVDGATVVSGAGVNTGTIDMIDGAFGDTLSFGAGLSGDGVYNTEIDLSLPTGGTSQSDFLIVRGGETTGDLTFNFTDLGAFSGLQADPIMILDADENFDYSYTFDNSTGLPVGGLIFYSLNQIEEDLVIQSQVNPALGGLVAAASLPESLLGSRQNQHGTDACGTGSYARLSRGRANTETTTDTGVAEFQNKLAFSYYGIEGGFSTGCANPQAGGWSFAYGAFVGQNTGHTQQLAYAIDPFNSQSLDTSVLNSIIDTRFENTYGGGYVTMANGPVSANVELRFDRSTFDISETVVNGAALGVDGQSMETNSITIAGQVAYQFDLNQTGLSLTPHLGFSHAKTDSDRTINFATGETLNIESYDTSIMSIGVTLANTLETENTFARPYISMAYFQDVSGDRTSVFGDQGGSTQALQTSGLDGYGQLTIGVDHHRVLNSGSAASPKTLSVGVHAGVKFGETISESFDIAASVRFTF